LAEALLGEGVDGEVDRIADWDATHDRSNQLRQGYYDTQFSTIMTASRKLVGRVMLEVARTRMKGSGFTFGGIKDVVETYNGHNAVSEWRMPKDHDEESSVTHLVHCGALQETSDGSNMICPFPASRIIIKKGGFGVSV